MRRSRSFATAAYWTIILPADDLGCGRVGKDVANISTARLAELRNEPLLRLVVVYATDAAGRAGKVNPAALVGRQSRLRPRCSLIGLVSDHYGLPAHQSSLRHYFEAHQAGSARPGLCHDGAVFDPDNQAHQIALLRQMGRSTGILYKPNPDARGGRRCWSTFSGLGTPKGVSPAVLKQTGTRNEPDALVFNCCFIMA
jgi:hypothetical protein